MKLNIIIQKTINLIFTAVTTSNPIISTVFTYNRQFIPWPWFKPSNLHLQIILPTIDLVYLRWRNSMRCNSMQTKC